jgi:hypothetical protein
MPGDAEIFKTLEATDLVQADTRARYAALLKSLQEIYKGAALDAIIKSGHERAPKALASLSGSQRSLMLCALLFIFRIFPMLQLELRDAQTAWQRIARENTKEVELERYGDSRVKGVFYTYDDMVAKIKRIPAEEHVAKLVLYLQLTCVARADYGSCQIHISRMAMDADSHVVIPDRKVFICKHKTADVHGVLEHQMDDYLLALLKDSVKRAPRRLVVCKKNGSAMDKNAYSKYYAYHAAKHIGPGANINLARKAFVTNLHSAAKTNREQVEAAKRCGHTVATHLKTYDQRGPQV